MKIAYLTQSYPPMISGAALVVQHLAQGMVARGHDVLVLAASDQGRSYTTETPCLRIVRLPAVPNPSRANQHFIGWAYSRIYHELQAFNPDVIHLHDALTVGLAGLQAGKKLGIPTALTTHQLPWFVSAYLPAWAGLREKVEGTLWKYCKWLNKQTDQFIAPTPTIAKVIEARIGSHPVVISNGMDLERFTPQPLSPAEREHLCVRFGLDPARPIILHVGRLDADKQVNLVVQAAAKAMRHTNAQLLVIGDGQQHARLVQLSAWRGMQARCHFPGFVQPGDDLAAIYRMASVFVTASEIETQGLVLLEAMASGVPVVAVRATCVPELVQERVNGYLVAPKDVDMLAERIVEVLETPARAREMGLAGRQIAEQHARVRSFDRHEALYQALCGQAFFPSSSLRLNTKSIS